MGNSSSKSHKPRRASRRYSNDIVSPKCKETPERDEPPPYSTQSANEAYHTVPELPPGSRHTRLSMLPKRTLTPPNQYNDSNYLRQSLRKQSRENALEMLRKYDTVLVVDDSGSMQGHRWEEVGVIICPNALHTRKLTLYSTCAISGKECTF